MDLNLVARALGQELVAGCPAQPAFDQRVAAASNVGDAAGASPFESHSGPCYVALGRNRLAIFAYKSGAFAFAPGPLLASHELDDIASCEYWPARSGDSRLLLTTRGGVVCDLAIALAHRGTGHRIADAIEDYRRSRAA